MTEYSEERGFRLSNAAVAVCDFPAARRRGRFAVLLILLLCLAAPAAAQKPDKTSEQKSDDQDSDPLLWRDPTDIRSRNLFYGPGGTEDGPRAADFQYEKEDLKGTNPKFDVRDADGIKWRVKLGEEAKPETVASRLLWAVGYFTNEDYFLPEIRVRGMEPVSKKRRKRVQGLVEPDGTMYNARLKRHAPGVKKVGIWRWRQNPFLGTRELNGLRVMMAVINNWDLTDDNNAIYAEKDRGDQKRGSDSSQVVYMVSDIGASFGTAGRVRDRRVAKGNLDSYRRSKFMCKINRDYVDLCVPARESWPLAVNPKEYIRRLRLRSLGRHLPRADAKWIGELLARLSPEQIRDAFRAGGYSPEQADGFSNVVAKRIAELNDL